MQVRYLGDKKHKRIQLPYPHLALGEATGEVVFQGYGDVQEVEDGSAKNMAKADHGQFELVTDEQAAAPAPAPVSTPAVSPSSTPKRRKKKKSKRAKRARLQAQAGEIVATDEPEGETFDDEAEDDGTEEGDDEEEGDEADTESTASEG